MSDHNTSKDDLDLLGDNGDFFFWLSGRPGGCC